MGTYHPHVQLQEASYFCLENDNWSIIGLDTGYDSIKGFLGIGDNLNLEIPEEQIEWLEKNVKINGDKRGIMDLTIEYGKSELSYVNKVPDPQRAGTTSS